MNNVLFILPAHGRKYNSVYEIVEAWDAGRDFKVISGPYLSVGDLDKLSAWSQVWIIDGIYQVRVK